MRQFYWAGDDQSIFSSVTEYRAPTMRGLQAQSLGLCLGLIPSSNSASCVYPPFPGVSWSVAQDEKTGGCREGFRFDGHEACSYSTAGQHRHPPVGIERC